MPGYRETSAPPLLILRNSYISMQKKPSDRLQISRIECSSFVSFHPAVSSVVLGVTSECSWFTLVALLCGWRGVVGLLVCGYQREVLYHESGEVLEQLPRGAVDAPSIPGGVHGQVGWALGSLGWCCVWRLVALLVAGGLELGDP